MDFGRVEKDRLAQINFKLPKEPYTNSTVLKDPANRHPKFFIGLSKWGRKEWIGKLYPKGTKEANYLDEYVKHFNFIELNATHYKLYSQPDLQKWIDKTKNTDFTFSPKFYQGISHFGSFKDKAFITDTFLNSMRHFGKNLGPIFLQVSDKFGPKRKEELFEYLSSFPKDISFFLEVRHPDWFMQPIEDELFSQLRKLRIGAVIVDTAGRRDVCHMHVTVPKTFIRFIANDLHQTDFERLDEWVTRIKYWVDSGLQEIYFVIHCLDETFAPELANYLIKALNKNCNAGLKEIQFMDQA
jgi:uncharacterized protein YecE (DUF72 family)